MPVSSLAPPSCQRLQDYGLTHYKLTMGQTQQRETSQEIDIKALQDMYRKFITECPSGVLFLHEFKRFFGVESTGEAAEYAENMFRAFDRNGDDTIDFIEFVVALNLAFRGDMERKLQWSFKLYDKDNNGTVDRKELRSMFDIIYRIKKGSKTGVGDSQLTVDEVVDRILQAVDSDGDGEITMEEFIRGAKEDAWVLSMLELDLNPVRWVMEQQRRKSATF